MTATSSFQEQIASAVRVELARQRKTQAWLAAQIGLTASVLSRRMSGETTFNTSEIQEIAGKLGVPVTDLTNPVQR